MSTKPEIHQQLKLEELKKVYKEFTVGFMKDGESISSQAETLTSGELVFRDFDFGDGFLVNEKRKTLLILPEKSLTEAALFLKAKESFDFKSKNLTFSMPKSISDIDYLDRENNHKGLMEYKGEKYDVYEKSPSHHLDKATLLILKKLTPEVNIANALEPNILTKAVESKPYRNKM